MQTERLQIAGMLKRDDKHGRLKDARQRHYRTAKEAAEALGSPYGTYSGHESGSRGFSNEEAARYARFFRVRLDWLLFGTGSSQEMKLKPLLGKIERGGVVSPIDNIFENPNQQFVIIESIIAEAACAYAIMSHDMIPWYNWGYLLVCGYRQSDHFDINQKLVIVSIKNENTRLAIANIDESSGLFDLECFGYPNIKRAEIEWAEEVLAIIPNRNLWSLSSGSTPKPALSMVE
ncbi:Helix-turn-helix [Methylobacterium gossipiicola]|uniref:Helix-turn-helix n=2 Tax=Methylobacterium gossipiicola TaxID=582675 RepID=A0A1I2VVX4_9HYPH|nr:Helix-turn-helix [Methylobacterium gossipiicola]